MKSTLMLLLAIMFFGCVEQQPSQVNIPVEEEHTKIIYVEKSIKHPVGIAYDCYNIRDGAFVKTYVKPSHDFSFCEGSRCGSVGIDFEENSFPVPEFYEHYQNNPIEQTIIENKTMYQTKCFFTDFVFSEPRNISVRTEVKE